MVVPKACLLASCLSLSALMTRPYQTALTSAGRAVLCPSAYTVPPYPQREPLSRCIVVLHGQICRRIHVMRVRINTVRRGREGPR